MALLKIPASGLPVIPLGDSSDLPVGEPVMAIGTRFSLAATRTARGEPGPRTIGPAQRRTGRAPGSTA